MQSLPLCAAAIRCCGRLLAGHIYCVVVGLVVLSAPLSHAVEQRDSNHSYRFAIGAGGNYSFPAEVQVGWAGGFVFSYQRDFHVVSLRYLSSEGFGSPLNRFVTDYGALYGIGFHNATFLLSLSTGIEYVVKSWPRYEGSYDSTRSDQLSVTNAWGIPLQFQALVAFGNNVGLGLIGFGDINPGFTHFGVMLCVQVGVL